MGTLIAPGVSVTVTDESLVSSAGNGTLPLYIFATAQDKLVPNSNTTAVGTKAANAEKLYLLTSQKDVLETFGNPVFQTSNGSVVQGDELNEYGLHGLYSYMGIANRAYAVRANVDLYQLAPTSVEPTGPVKSGTYWLDTATSVVEAYVPSELAAKNNASAYSKWERRTVHIIRGVDYGGCQGDWATRDLIKNDSSILVGDLVMAYMSSSYQGQDAQSTANMYMYIKEINDAVAYYSGDFTIAPLNAVPTAFSTAAGTGYKLWIRSGFTKVGTKYTGTFLSGYVYNSFSDKWVSTPIYLAETDAVAEQYAGGHIGVCTGTVLSSYINLVSGTTPGATDGTANPGILTMLSGTFGSNAVLVFKYNGITRRVPINIVTDSGTVTAAEAANIVHKAIINNLDLANDGILSNHASGSTSVSIISKKGYAVAIYQDFTYDSSEYILFNGTVYIDCWGTNFGFVYDDVYIQNTEPTGKAVDGTYWYNFEPSDSLLVSVYQARLNPVTQRKRWVSCDVIVSADVPTTTQMHPGIIWVKPLRQGIDGYEFYNVVNGTNPVKLNTADQTTTNGILFGDIRTVASADLYMDGMILCDLSSTEGVVMQMTDGVWKVASGVAADGSGVFGKAAQRKVIVEKLADAIISNETLRAEYVDFNLICAPGYIELLDELVTLNTDRRETAFIVTDVPSDLVPTGTEIQNWATNANNAVGNGPDGRVTRYAYAAQYAGWCYGTNVDGTAVAIPASTVAMRTYAYSDSVSYVWFPPAGTNRGVVTNASSVGYITDEGEFQPVLYSKGQLETMYSNSINPIELRTSRGLVVMGDKTLNADDTAALSRVNVARLVVYIRRQIEKLSEGFLFKLNTATTRQEFAGALNAMLANLVQLDGLYDFQVVCDTSNNTAVRIDRNELWADIAIQPTKSINFIYVPIRIQKTS